jgi:hypothetical protein
VPVPAGVWLLEDVQPVAAFVDTAVFAGAGGPPRLVGWAGTPPAPPDSPRVAVADGDRFAVQDGEGAPVVRIAAGGGVRVHPAPGLSLRAAHDGDLWLTGGATAIAPRQVFGEPSPPLPLAEGIVVAIHPDGSRRHFTVNHPVACIAPDPCGLAITVDEPPTSSHIAGLTSLPTSTVLLGWDDRSPHVRIEDLPASPAPRQSRRAWMWHDRDLDRVRASAVPGLGLLWSAGRVRTGAGPDHPVLVTGHDPATLAERVRVDLGIGCVLDVAVVDQEIWLAVRRGRRVDPDRPVQVVAITAAGQVRVVLGADTVDITDRCRPLIDQDEDARIGYPRRERDSYGELQAYWHHPDGTTTPLAEGMCEAAVAVRGEWPDTVLEFICRHVSRPGLLLRRRVRLFDEFGRPTEPGPAGIFLMESLDTGQIPPSADARDGILDV